MADVLVTWDNDTGTGGISTTGADLSIDDTGLESAVLISLFTDRRVRPDDLPPGQTDRRGWWGDTLTPNDQIGSELWLLDREKQTNETLARAEGYCREALVWLVEDGVARAVDVTAEWIGRGTLGICVSVELPQQETVEYQFQLN